MSLKKDKDANINDKKVMSLFAEIYVYQLLLLNITKLIFELLYKFMLHYRSLQVQNVMKPIFRVNF